MSAIDLTEEIVEMAFYTQPPTKRGYRCMVWDLKLTGFGLRVYPSGRKVYVCMFLQKGVKRLWVIGHQSKWSLKEARVAARNLLRDVEPIYA